MKVTKKEILKFVLDANISQELKFLNRAEEYMVKRILNEELWLEKSIEEQQERRILSLGIAKKTKNIDDYQYEASYVKVVGQVELLIHTLESNYQSIKNINNFNVLKFYALLIIERGFLREAMFSQKHVPIELFEGVFKEASEWLPEISSKLKDFMSFYRNMYTSWPNKPE